MPQFTKSSLDFDDINWKYFDALYKSKKNMKDKERLVIGENVFFSLKDLPIHSYQDLKKKAATYLKIAKGCSLWLKKAQGGGGTSIKREEYLRKITKEKHIHTAAKGTDLFIRLDEGSENLVSLAELQILQSIQSLLTGQCGELFFNDLVGRESQQAIQKIWKKKSWIDKNLSYEKLNTKIKGFNKLEEILQAPLPTFDDKGELTLRRQAPGGHGFFAFEALISALNGTPIPNSNGRPLISIIGNGEDLGSTPDGIIFGWIIDEKIPIVMMTTEKTEIDLKGGQIVTKKDRNGHNSIAIIEQAQAKESGMLELFEKNKGLFNTNVAIFNYSELIPKLKKLRDKIGNEMFEKAVTPTLIENKKKQKEENGEIRAYEQLEGAMGSTLLNLDCVWRQNFNEPLVHFVNIEKQNRTQFFSPVKTAFDFFMLFHSDRFSLDKKSFKLIDNRPGALPLINLPQDHYLEVQNVLDAFENTEILELDLLNIEGSPVILKKLKLIGDVRITNSFGALFDLSSKLQIKGIKELKNQSVRITPQGDLIIP